MGNRLGATGADSSVGATLHDFDAIDGSGIDAGESPGAVRIFDATPAAERAFRSVGDADILCPARGGAVAGVRTGFTEVGIVGDANENQVRTAGTDRLATPSLGTFFLALPGADSFAQMLYAPS